MIRSLVHWSSLLSADFRLSDDTVVLLDIQTAQLIEQVFMNISASSKNCAQGTAHLEQGQPDHNLAACVDVKRLLAQNNCHCHLSRVCLSDKSRIISRRFSIIWIKYNSDIVRFILVAIGFVLMRYRVYRRSWGKLISLGDEILPQFAHSPEDLSKTVEGWCFRVVIGLTDFLVQRC